MLLVDRSRIGDPKTASFGLTRSIRSDYLDPFYSNLAFEARGLWLALQKEVDEPFLIDCGCLNLARDDVTPDRPATYAAQSFEVLQGLGRRAEAFDRARLQSRFPQFDADLGRLDVEAGVLYLPAITAALQRRLREREAAIEEKTEVLRISAHVSAIRIETSAGERRARRLVVAAGLGTNELLAAIDGCELRLPLRPDRPSEAKYVIPPADRRKDFEPEHLPVFAYLDVGIYGHPMLPGRTPGVKIGYYNPPDIARRETAIDSVASFIEKCLPALHGAQMIDVEGVDQCSYDLVADDNFIVGAIPDVPDVVVGTGWRGTGYKFSPLMGRTLMELALDHRSSVDVSRFTPARFAQAHAR